MNPRPDRMSSIQIAKLLAVADGIRKNTSESERREAITQLLSEFRSQYEQAVREMKDHQKARAAVIGTADAAMTTAAQSTTDQITAEFDALRLTPPFDPLLMQSVQACATRIFNYAALITGAQTTAELDALGPGPGIDPLLVQGVKAWAFRIFLEPDPILVLERFLGTRRPRGKRAKNTERDVSIAVTVVEKMKSGMTLEDASYAVAESCGLEGESVKKIYRRNHREAKAHVAMLAMDNISEKEGS
jgi:hypothetical protein